MVGDVLAAARRRYPGVPDIEEQVDAFVDARGGDRTGVVDPWRAMANVLRRLGGRAVVGRDDIYALAVEAVGVGSSEMTDVRRRPREWPYWVVAVVLWALGTATVVAGEGMWGALILASAGAVLLVRQWQLRRHAARGDGLKDGASFIDLSDS